MGNPADAGGGAGFFGGGASYGNSGGGGSSYIASSLLTSNGESEKHMYCYNCTTSASSQTKTLSEGVNSCASSRPYEDCAKVGHGYVRITYIGE